MNILYTSTVNTMIVILRDTCQNEIRMNAFAALNGSLRRIEYPWT